VVYVLSPVAGVVGSIPIICGVIAILISAIILLEVLPMETNKYFLAGKTIATGIMINFSSDLIKIVVLALA
jgi:hypothetical protein